jgi:cellulose biosynthesis protein BcsQ
MVRSIMATVICMASAKGGSGKTVLTATFSAFLVALGKRVLMIDTDSSTNGLTLMFLKETMMQTDSPLGIYEISATSKPPRVVKTSTGAHLIPATYSFTNTELVPGEQFGQSLQSTLQRSGKDYDFIFLDAQAGADSSAHLAMSRKNSDQVVIVSEYDPLSAAGVERLKGLFHDDLTYVRTWILLNKMLPEFVRSFSDFMEVAKYANPIPWDADVVRAYARRRLALDLEKGNEFTLAVVQTLKSILGDEIRAELDSWLLSKTSALREPIETQYSDAEKELESLIREHRLTSQSEAGRQGFRDLTSALGLLLVVLEIFLGALYRSVLVQTRFIWIVPIAAVSTVSIAIKIFRDFRYKERYAVDAEVMEARFQRQRESIQARLRKLEALKSAGPEILFKHGSGGYFS